MRGIEKLFIALLLLVGLEAFSQNEQSGLREMWAAIYTQDDYEKNFRFPNFIDSLRDVEGLEDVDSLRYIIPNNWSYAIDADTSILVVAGVLPYESEPHRLIYLIQQLNQHHEIQVFTAQLSSPLIDNSQPSVQLEDYSISHTNFLSLKISVGTTLVFDLPDVLTRLVLQDLVESEIDEEKLLKSQELWNRLALLLKYEPLFKNDFSGYERVSTLHSPDGLIKVLTWNLELENGTNSFRGAVAVNRNGEVVVHELTDNYQSIKNPEQASLSTSKWFGAVYYDIIEHSFRGDTFYTLLGYNPNNQFSKMRVIEVLSLSSNGTPRFGNAILEVDGRSLRRMIFEYSNSVSMMLRYDANEQMIVMDNLVPSAPMFQNDYRHYGPDFTHNGFSFEKGKWVYFDNIELRNRRVR
jgi:hypothetical protein